MTIVAQQAYYNENDPKKAAWLRGLIKRDAIAPGEIDERDIRDVQPSDLDGFTQHHFFAGIGGWSYALRLAGWPDDKPVWTGSCPCQPFSNAGKRLGTEDRRHLWPEFLRLIRQCRPAIVVGEQVTGGIADAWLGSVLDDLEAEDFAVGAVHLPAASVGAPHIRQRAFWVGFTDQSRWDKRHATGETVGFRDTSVATGSSLGHTIGTGLPAPESSSVLGTGRWKERGATGESSGSFWDGGEWRSGPDGKSRWVEPGIRLLAHGVPGRVELLRGYGNAIVPQVAAQVIMAIMT